MALAAQPLQRPPVVGLVLTGGGARAAYQVGVLTALAEFLPRGRNPFPVITGTSAGAVAASVLAAQAFRWRQAVAGLAEVWSNFRVDQVFEVAPPAMLRAAAHWTLALLSGGFLLQPPRSLLDNSPLHQLLEGRIDWQGVRTSIDRGHLRGLALSATCYRTGQSIAFYDGRPEIDDWARIQRRGVRTHLTLEHLIASAAIPMLFPPVQLADSWFGDGAMRQQSPLSPAIHLGANRLLIIGVRGRREAGVSEGPLAMPAAGQILGFMLDTLFSDQIYSDLEETERLNQLVAHVPGMPDSLGRRLSRIETLMLTPSEDLRAIAARHAAAMPSGLRALLRVTGARNGSSSQLASYLMFESPFTRELMDLGYHDAKQLSGVLRDFIGGVPLPVRQAGI